MEKKLIKIQNIAKTHKRLGERTLPEYALKMVAGGHGSEGGTSSASADTDS
ncbi:MAG TPA: hypothetical protein VH877_26020 [Polyangia bacterium]|jgi:hypothetical protein|nr:hypothetical protein [Polyangia bacterium]